MDTSFWAGIASVVVGFGVLATALLVVSDAELRAVVDQLAAQGRPVTLDQARAIYRMAVVAMFVIVAVIAALWILFLFFMRRGRNWARIVVTVVGVLWFLLALPSAVGGAAGGRTDVASAGNSLERVEKYARLMGVRLTSGEDRLCIGEVVRTACSAAPDHQARCSGRARGPERISAGANPNVRAGRKALAGGTVGGGVPTGGSWVSSGPCG